MNVGDHVLIPAQVVAVHTDGTVNVCMRALSGDVWQTVRAETLLPAMPTQGQAQYAVERLVEYAWIRGAERYTSRWEAEVAAGPGAGARVVLVGD